MPAGVRCKGGDGSSGAPTTANLGKKLKGFLGGSGRGRRSGVGGGVRAPPAAVADIPGRGSASRGGRSCGPPYAPLATETVLLNSMRRLLVWLPQLQEMLVKWCGGYRSAAASGVGSLRQRGLAASRAGEDNFPARFCGQFQHVSYPPVHGCLCFVPVHSPDCGARPVYLSPAIGRSLPNHSTRGNPTLGASTL